MYATIQDMKDRYTESELIELTDRADPATDAIVDAVLENALNDATGLVDSYVANIYKTPLNPVPKAITIHVCAIAYYRLHQTRYTDEARQTYEDAIAFLEKVSTGKIVLSVDGKDAKSTTANARVSGYNQAFNRDSLEGF